MEKAPVLYQFTVTYGERQVTLAAPNPAKAIYDAAAQWGEDFKYVAGYCVAVKGGKARKPMCQKCGKEHGKPGDKQGLCLDCQRIADLIHRDMAQRRMPDRRARYGR